MSDKIAEMLGKRIKGVVMKECTVPDGQPKGQLFIVFDDDTYFEFYSRTCAISAAKGCWVGGIDKVEAYMDATMKIVSHAVEPSE